LLWVLREDLKLTGTKYGCGVAACGACTVHVGGVATRACVLPVSLVGDRPIVTIEAVGNDAVGRIVQDAWVSEDVVQCGYCQSGQIMTAVALLKSYVQTLIELDRDGYAPRKSLFTGVIARFGIPSGVAETLLDDYRDGFPNACVLFPDAGQTLSCLRTSGLKLGLITNGSIRMQSRKLQCLALSPLFDSILISDAEGISKPDRQIFHRALDRLNTNPAQAVFVGDHPEIDVAGARAAGMQAIWRRDPTVSRIVEADGVIEELGDLFTWLG
jgi:putative hydrolase of the HAD superfamily